MASMRQAINNMCKACIYDKEAGFGTWRQQTEACTAKSCPLWSLRPISQQNKHGEEKDEQ